MTTKQVDEHKDASTVPPLELNKVAKDLRKALQFSQPTDEEMGPVAELRAKSEPWAERGETSEQSLEALMKLRPFTHVARHENQLLGYVTIERDGPVQGAAYMRNIVVKSDMRRQGLGEALLDHAMNVARDMHRRTLALRVDPSNAAAVSFYRKAGFTTVATVVSKKSGKLRLLMSKEL